MIDRSKIAIISTVINFNLYEKTSIYFPNGIRKYIIDGRNKMYGIDSILFMIKKLKNRGIEWLIMADEDVIFIDSEIVFDIIKNMKSNNITVSGVRDGGVINHRNYNPNVINTFFSIVNFKKIEKYWKKDEMLKNQYIIKSEFHDELETVPFKYDEQSLFVPYYCFYLWIRRKGWKIWFLDSEIHNDNIANGIYFKNKLLLWHTWYARKYGVSKAQTNRINEILEMNNGNFGLTNYSSPIIFKKRCFIIYKIIKRYSDKIKINF